MLVLSQQCLLTICPWLQQQAEGCIGHSQVVISPRGLLELAQELVLTRVRDKDALQHLVLCQLHLPAQH